MIIRRHLDTERTVPQKLAYSLRSEAKVGDAVFKHDRRIRRYTIYYALVQPLLDLFDVGRIQKDLHRYLLFLNW
jgi:hypothetical protein